MTKIAQAYFHFETKLSSSDFQNFGEEISKISKKAAKNHFSTKIAVDIEIEEGSLIGRITAHAMVLGVFTGILSDYKGVRDSVELMCEDARSFGTDVCGKAIQAAGITERQVFRTERRTKTVGKLGRLLNDVERLENSLENLSSNQIRKELKRLHREFEKINTDLSPQDQTTLEYTLKKTKLPSLPDWPSGKDEEKGPRVVIRVEQMEIPIAEKIEIEDGRNRKSLMRYKDSFVVIPQRARNLEQPPLIDRK